MSDGRRFLKLHHLDEIIHYKHRDANDRGIDPYPSGHFQCAHCKLMGTPSIFKDYHCNDTSQR